MGGFKEVVALRFEKGRSGGRDLDERWGREAEVWLLWEEEEERK